jgi:MOSC domain-containing protein YiiM
MEYAMTWQGTVKSIHLGEANVTLRSVEQAEAQAGLGLVGDRYHAGTGAFSKKQGPDREITLIEQEALDGFAQEYGISLAEGESRRNVTTVGVPLNHLVGKSFKIGDVVLRGIRLCEPCGHLKKLTGKDVDGLKHRGGLRAQIVHSGVIHCGDTVEPVQE